MSSDLSPGDSLNHCLFFLTLERRTRPKRLLHVDHFLVNGDLEKDAVGIVLEGERKGLRHRRAGRDPLSDLSHQPALCPNDSLGMGQEVTASGELLLAELVQVLKPAGVYASLLLNLVESLLYRPEVVAHFVAAVSVLLWSHLAGNDPSLFHDTFDRAWPCQKDELLRRWNRGPFLNIMVVAWLLSRGRPSQQQACCPQERRQQLSLDHVARHGFTTGRRRGKAALFLYFFPSADSTMVGFKTLMRLRAIYGDYLLRGPPRALSSFPRGVM